MTVLGKLDYNAVLGEADYASQQTLIEKEMLDRFVLGMGSPPGTEPSSGIVDVLKPSSISSTETSRPLLVTVSSLDPLKIEVKPGTVVTGSGAIIVSNGNLALDLIQTQDNDVLVVLLENSLVTDGIPLLNEYNQPLAPRLIQSSDSLKTVLLSDFLDTAQFPPERRANVEVIAIVTVVPTTLATQELQVDLTQNVYSFNRKWFSLQDTTHRNSIGSGIVTEKNPHGTSLNDLSTAGNVNLFQGTNDTGTIVSRDRDVARMPGKLCFETIPQTRIIKDLTGLVTARSRYGGTDAHYCELLAFPTRLGSLFEVDQSTSTDVLLPANSFAGEVIEGTNILVFGSPLGTRPTGSFRVEYTQSDALLPPVSAPINLLTFSQPSSTELIVAGGTTIAAVPDPVVDLEGAGPFPRHYEIYCNEQGGLVNYPQIVIPTISLGAIGTSIYESPRVLAFPARLRLGLTKATVLPTTTISVQLNGKDLLGNPLNETLTLAQATGYVDEIVPSQNYDSAAQTVLTENIYAVLDSIQVTNRVDDGAMTLLQLWGEIEPNTAPELNDLAWLCTLDWNGQGIARIEDRRLISRGFHRPESGLEAVGEISLDSARLGSILALTPLLNQESVHLFTEDFEDLKHFDTVRGFHESTAARGVISVTNNGVIAPGNTIQIKPGKILTAMTSGANPALGQFNIGAGAEFTRQNIRDTINDVTFASGVSAALGSGNDVNLTLTTPLGSPGNDIVMSASNLSAFGVISYRFGYDPVGECFVERGRFGIKSRKIPDNSNLTPSGYEYRTRYRSRAKFDPLQESFAIQLHGQDRFVPTSVRIRGVPTSSPGTWTSWKICTAVSPGVGGLYRYDFSAPVDQIQVEFYGTARGLSVYRIQQST